MAFGVNWVFERSRMGDYRAGYAAPPPADWPLARAVAASSCFPPVFNPLPVRVGPQAMTGGSFPEGPRRDALVGGMRLTDGGDYDNLGLEPVWKNHSTVLVSDGGAPLDTSEDRGLLWRVTRYSEILGNQAHALRLRWLIASFDAGTFKGSYWGLRSAMTSYDPGFRDGYSKDLATQVIAGIRTDLDAFSAAEASVLENHGYWLTEAALRRHVAELIPADAPAPRTPHPEWMDEDRVRAALRTSGKRRLFR
jgi:NTE family protein